MTDELKSTAIELCWRHWTALGVRGVAPIPDDAVDLEALIAFTPFIADEEPRLADEARDWCARLAPKYVSLSRLKQVARRFPDPPRDALTEIVAAAAQRERRVATSGKSVDPELMRPALLSLRARRVFGVGARADLIVALLRRRGRPDGVSAADLVSVGYTKRNIAQVLDELASAGVLERMSVRNSANFWLAREHAIVELLAPIPSRIAAWAERFAIAATVLDVARRNVNKSRVSFAVDLNKRLDRLDELAQPLEVTAPRVRGPDAVIEATIRWATDLLGTQERGLTRPA
jgi:hypothetical protein